MAYVPQFIQTDTSVLQGTLNQYQQGYDTETNRQNQVNDTYSAIPTSQIDTADKNQVMGQFSKVREELDKKYNYDRSNTQYAKELASRITDLRANPLWGHLQQKEELSKIRQQLIATKGADYMENFNPDSITVRDSGKLQSWKPLDLEDVKKNAALKAKEFATAWVGRTHDRTSVPGTIQYLDQWGAKNEKEAEIYLKSHPEELLASVPDGFDPKDPRVLQTAANAWISNAVGEIKPSEGPDNAYLIDERNSHAKGKIIPNTTWVKRTNIGVNSPSPIEGGLPALENINKQIADIDATPSKTPDQIAQRDVLQRQVDYARNEYMTVANSPKGQKVIQQGMQIINEKISNPLVDKQQLFREFENYFVQTNQASRSAAGAEGVGIINQIVSDFSPWFTKEVKDGKDVFKPKDLKHISEDITNKLVANNADSKTREVIKKEILDTAKEFSKFYNGESSYKDLSYKDNIEKPVNQKLKEGKLMVADVYDPPYDIGTTDYNKAVDTVVRNIGLNVFDMETENKKGKLTPVSATDSKGIYERLTKNQSNIRIHAAMEGESEPRIILTEPDGNKLTLKMNIPKMGRGTAYELADATGLSQFKDGFYKDIKLENKTYSLADNKDKTLTNIISKTYGDTKPFTGLEITKVGDSEYIIKSDAIAQQGYPQGYTVHRKLDMMETLDDIYTDYNKNSKQ